MLPIIITVMTSSLFPIPHTRHCPKNSVCNYSSNSTVFYCFCSIYRRWKWNTSPGSNFIISIYTAWMKSWLYWRNCRESPIPTSHSLSLEVLQLKWFCIWKMPVKESSGSRAWILGHHLLKPLAAGDWYIPFMILFYLWHSLKNVIPISRL